MGYVSTGPPVAMTPAMAPGTPAPGTPGLPGLQEILSEQNNSMSSMLSQAMAPVMQSIQQLSINQQTMQNMIHSQQEMLERLGKRQDALHRALPQGVPESDDEEIMDEEGNCGFPILIPERQRSKFHCIERNKREA